MLLDSVPMPHCTERAVVVPKLKMISMTGFEDMPIKARNQVSLHSPRV